MKPSRLLLAGLLVALAAGLSPIAPAQEVPEPLKQAVDAAIAKVKPALVRVAVVSTYYREGREQKYESSGSGVIVTPEGHIVTNHHVAGHATRLVCTLSTKEEIEAELIGRDPLTDIAVIKLTPESPRTFPVAEWGDSSAVKVGDHVLAMGSPMSLSQSVTLGIVSNAELVMPKWIQRWGGMTLDGENVGALVRWIGHDAEIYGGNSGGPLVDMAGRVIGINEISIGLGGAIPGNLARTVAEELMAHGEISRAWLGAAVQPQLKHADRKTGILISSVIGDGPADAAGIQPGDILMRLGGTPIDVRFLEQLPEFNQLTADLPIGEPVEAIVLRGGQEVVLRVTPEKREPLQPKEIELKQWGITARDLSLLMAKQLKRDTQDGVLVTSVRPGGPAGDAKPQLDSNDIIVAVGERPVASLMELRTVTDELTEGKTEPTPAVVVFERKSEQYLTVVKVGIKKLEDPGLEVKKAWLPVKTQVLIRDMAKELGYEGMTGFRITQVFTNSTAEKAGLRVGDLILEVDGEPLTASAPEDYEQLTEWIRQYRIGDTAELLLQRGDERLTIPVELVRAPKLTREMKKYENTDFDFTVRNVTFFDKAEEKWAEEQQGVLVHEVKSGGWAALGALSEGDLLISVDDAAIADVDALEAAMTAIEAAEPKAVVFQVLRGIHTVFLELEPKWNETLNAEKE